METKEISRKEIIDSEDDEFEEGLSIPAYEDSIEVVDDELLTKVKKRQLPAKAQRPKTKDQKPVLVYVILPAIFLAVTLFGGLRFGALDNAFILSQTGASVSCFRGGLDDLVFSLRLDSSRWLV